MRNAYSSVLVFAVWLALVLGCAGGRRQSLTETLKEEHRIAINSALMAKNYPRPISIEITDGGWLVVSFELLGRAPHGKTVEVFGTEAVIAVREAMLPYE